MTKEELVAAFVILECEPGCSSDEVKSSYRQLVKVWHPDRFDGDPKLTIKATEKMKLINDSYQLLETFFEQVQCEKESNRQPANPDTHANSNRSETDEADQEVGDETVEILQERDPQSGQTYFKKVIETITGDNGRWLSKQTKVFKTKPISGSDSFESVAKQSMSFRLRPEEGRRGSHWDYGGGLGENEHDGTGNEYLFPDGSSVSVSNVSTDTWFHDDNKKAVHGRTSSTLAGLGEAYQVFKKRRDWQVCAEIGQRSVDLHGQDSWGWIQRSFALHCLKNTKAAFDALKPAANLFPKKIMISYNLACYAAQLGDLQGAKNWLQGVFDLAEKEGPYSGTFERYRKMALGDSDLVSVRNAVPQPPLKWKLRKYFGL